MVIQLNSQTTINMRSLTLDHIAPYLPYRLELYYTHTQQFGVARDLYSIEDNDSDDIKIKINHMDGEHIWMFQPLLHPLSTLTTTLIPFDNITTTMEDYITGNWDLGEQNWILSEVAKGQQIGRLFDLPYSAIQLLFKYHFDVFTLIPEDLALDKRYCGNLDKRYNEND